MKTNPKVRGGSAFIWLTAGLAVGVLLAVDPFHAPRVLPAAAWALCLIDLAVVVLLSANRITTRIGLVFAGAFLAIPFFLDDLPLWRFIFLCFVAAVFGIAAAVAFPPQSKRRRSLAFYFSWFGTHKLELQPRYFPVRALFHLLAASTVLGIALDVIRNGSALGAGRLETWLAGGIALLAYAEVLSEGHNFLTGCLGIVGPAFMRSPILSVSIADFWSRRWNVAMSELVFGPLYFAPFARHSVALALFAAFFASAVIHVLLCFLMLGRWPVSLVCGGFFLVQPLFILLERKLCIRRWSLSAARTWTWAVMAFASPLFVEPFIQILTPTLRQFDNAIVPAMIAVVVALGIILFPAFGQLLSVRQKSLAAGE